MKHFLFTLVFFFSSCSGSLKKQEAQFDQLLSQGKCDEAYEHIPESNFQKVYNSSKKVVGKGTRYLFVGVGYGIDIIVMVAATAIVFAPFIYHGGGMSATDDPHDAQFSTPYDDDSIPMKNQEKGKPGLSSRPANTNQDDNYFALTRLGPTLDKASRDYPCPDLSHITSSIIKISQCFEKKGEKQQALNQLRNIVSDSYYSKCLAKESMYEVKRQIARLKFGSVSVQ